VLQFAKAPKSFVFRNEIPFDGQFETDLTAIGEEPRIIMSTAPALTSRLMDWQN
jgi:hypothetical protein